MGRWPQPGQAHGPLGVMLKADPGLRSEKPGKASGQCGERTQRATVPLRCRTKHGLLRALKRGQVGGHGSLVAGTGTLEAWAGAGEAEVGPQAALGSAGKKFSFLDLSFSSKQRSDLCCPGSCKPKVRQAHPHLVQPGS